MSAAAKLTVFVSRHDHRRHHGVALDLFLRARRRGLAGATMIPAVEGFGSSHTVHTPGRASTTGAASYALIVIDTRPALEAFASEIQAELGGRGAVFLEDVDVISGHLAGECG